MNYPQQISNIKTVMNTTNTQNKTEQNYQLIVIDRYDIADSIAVVVTDKFIKNYVKYQKSETDGQIASLKCGYKGVDNEEQSFLWVKTDKQVNADSEAFMSEFEFE